MPGSDTLWYSFGMPMLAGLGLVAANWLIVAIGMAIEPRGVATTTSASGPPAGASDSAGMRYVPRPTSSLPCLSPSRGRTHASASHCFRDRPAQDRGGADRDVGDHRRRREPAAPEVGQRNQPAPSRFAAVAASA